MFPPLSEVRMLRRRLGLTQQQVAKAAGVSQSLVAKIEAEETDPAYSTATRILEFLEDYGKQRRLKAGEVMSRRVVCVSPAASLREAVKKIKSHDISQLPVMEGGHVVGVVSESDLLAALADGKQSDSVKDVMEDAPPQIPPSADIKTVSSLLRYCPLVAVQEKGRLLGVISKADLLEPLYGK